MKAGDTVIVQSYRCGNATQYEAVIERETKTLYIVNGERYRKNKNNPDRAVIVTSSNVIKTIELARLK